MASKTRAKLAEFVSSKFHSTHLTGWLTGRPDFDRYDLQFNLGLVSPSATLRIPEMLDLQARVRIFRNRFYQPITQMELDGILQSARVAQAKDAQPEG